MDDDYTFFLQQLDSIALRRRESIAAGVPALARLVELAERSRSGQAQTVAAFLAGLYDGPRYPLDLTELRGLDPHLQDDVITVLRMDAAATEHEIHCYFDDGERRFNAIFRAHQITARGR